MLEDMVIGFIGGGNMAKAIAEGILRKGLVKSSALIVSCVTAETKNKWESLNVETTHSNVDIIDVADIIILAVKPYQLDTALKNIHIRDSSKSKLFISILAGVNCETLFEKLHNYIQPRPRVIRVMPNTLVMVCEGCSAIAPHSSANDKDVNVVKQIFGSLGICEVVPECLMSAVTGLSGSGPAYIYAVIEALSDGGVKQGIPRNLASTFAAQTVLGAAKMVMDTKKHPGQLKDEVCSAGGTTIHGLYALEKGNLRATLMGAVEAATQRGDEISKMSQK